MKFKNLRIASLAMAAVVTLSAVPSTAFASEDLFTFEDVEWEGVLSEEEDLFGESFEETAPVADVVEDEDWFEFAGEDALVSEADDVVEEDWFELLADPSEAGEAGVNKASIQFFYGDKEVKDFTVRYWLNGEDPADTVKYPAHETTGYWYSADSCKTLGIAYDAATDAAYNKAATCLENEKHVMVAMIQGVLYYSSTDQSAENPPLYAFEIEKTALGHSWAEKDNTQEPVKVTLDNIEQLGKDNPDLKARLYAEKLPTCTAKGKYQLVYVCTRCGAIDPARISEVETPYKHNYVEQSKETLATEETKPYTEYTDKNDNAITVTSENTKLTASGSVELVDPAESGKYVVVTTSVCSICGKVQKAAEEIAIDGNKVYDRIVVKEKADANLNGIAAYYGKDPSTIDWSKITFVKCDAKESYYTIAYMNGDKEVYTEKIDVPAHHITGKVKFYAAADEKKPITIKDYVQIFIMQDEKGNVLDEKATDADIASIVGTWSCFEDMKYYTAETCPSCGKILGKFEEHTAPHKGLHTYADDKDENGKNDIEERIAAKKDGTDFDIALGVIAADKDVISCPDMMDAKGNYLGGFCHDKEVTVKYICKVCRKEEKEVKLTLKGQVDEALSKMTAEEIKALDVDDLVALHVGDIVSKKVGEAVATCTARGYADIARVCENCGDEIDVTRYYTSTNPETLHKYGDPQIAYEGTVVVDERDANTGALLEAYNKYLEDVKTNKDAVRPTYDYTVLEQADRDSYLYVKPVAVRVCSVCGKVEPYPGQIKPTIDYVEMQGKGCIAGAITLTATLTEDMIVAGGDAKKVVATSTETFPYYTSTQAYWGADPHTPSNEWVDQVVNADGSKVQVMKCLVCDQVIKTRNVAAPTHQHVGQLVEAKEATCTETGLKAHYVCTGCHELFEDEACTKAITDVVIPARGHQYGEEIAEVAATCGAPGMKAHYVCSDCGKFFVKDGEEYKEVTAEELAITEQPAHTLVANDEVPATYEAEGVKAHYACSVCGKLFVMEGEEYKEVTAADLVIPKLEKEVEAPGKVTIKSTSTYVGTGAIRVKVGTVEGADSYKIGIKEAGTKDYTTKTAEDMSVLFDNVKFDGKYVIRAYAKNAAGKGEYSYKRRWVHSVDVALTAGKGSIVVNLDGEGDAYLYKIRVSTTKDMADYETYKTTKTSYTITGLKAGQKYYVRVIPYVKVDGKVYRGAMSKREAKTVK